MAQQRKDAAVKGVVHAAPAPVNPSPLPLHKHSIKNFLNPPQTLPNPSLNPLETLPNPSLPKTSLNPP